MTTATPDNTWTDDGDDADGAPSGGTPAPGAVPDHVKAQYPDRAFFEYREVFLRHLMRDLSGRLHQQKDQAAPACLDIGCNGGRYTAMLAKHGFAARGVDYSADLVAEAKREHPGLAFDQGDAQDLPYPEEGFDAVATFGLIQVLPDWKFALSEAVRVLKPGGVALIETNRAAPLLENVVKSVAYAARRQLSPRAAWTHFCAHAQAARRPLERGLRKFSRGDLVGWAATLPVKYIVIHDPRKHRVLHDFMWAVTLAKRGPGDSPDALPAITECAHCRRHGVGQLREGHAWTS